MISNNANKILKPSSLSHFIYENANARNQKRFSQFSKRKNALSLDKKEKNKFKYNKFSPDKNINNNIDIINVFNFIINKYTINETKEKQKIDNNNNNSNQDNNYNNLIRENNILNLDEEKDIIIDYYQNSIDISNNNNDIMNKNEFALNYLTPHRKSFIKLGNNLTTKFKLQNNNFTDSYILALGLDKENNIKDKYHILQNFDTIKEEKEKENTKFKSSKSLSRYMIIHKRPKKLIKKKIYLSLEKKERKNYNNISPKKNLLLINNYNKENYKNKNNKLKIIKLNIANYDKNFVKLNIEKKIKNDCVIKVIRNIKKCK